ncbi:MAG TPA: cupin domain-containing protein, partial [Atribacterota bacterium]|nr:cupin domain-containing protein [Atribacterota bacterium]
MIIKRLQDTPIMKTAHNVDARNLYDTENAVISVITLKPGQALKKHITPVDVAFYVLRGKGVVEIGKEKQEVEA